MTKKDKKSSSEGKNSEAINVLFDKCDQIAQYKSKTGYKHLTFTVFNALIRQFNGRMTEIKEYLHANTSIRTSEAALLDKLASFKGISSNNYLFYPEWSMCFRLLEDPASSPELRKVCQDFIIKQQHLFVLPPHKEAARNRQKWLDLYTSRSSKSAITSRENGRKKRAAKLAAKNADSNV